MLPWTSRRGSGTDEVPKTNKEFEAKARIRKESVVANEIFILLFSKLYICLMRVAFGEEELEFIES